MPVIGIAIQFHFNHRTDRLSANSTDTSGALVPGFLRIVPRIPAEKDLAHLQNSVTDLSSAASWTPSEPPKSAPHETTTFEVSGTTTFAGVIWISCVWLVVFWCTTRPNYWRTMCLPLLVSYQKGIFVDQWWLLGWIAKHGSFTNLAALWVKFIPVMAVYGTRSDHMSGIHVFVRWTVELESEEEKQHNLRNKKCKVSRIPYERKPGT